MLLHFCAPSPAFDSADPGGTLVALKNSTTPIVTGNLARIFIHFVLDKCDSFCSNRVKSKNLDQIPRRNAAHFSLRMA